MRTRPDPGLLWPILLILGSTAVFQWAILRSGFLALSLDESGRTLDAWRWAHCPEFVSKGWLPAHRVLVGAALMISPDLVETPRVVSRLIGIVVLLALMWLAHGLFARRDVTIATGMIASLLPATLVLSVVPLSEILFVLCVLFGCGAHLRWLRSGRLPWLLLGTSGYALGAMVRYEGWIFVGMHALLLTFHGFRRSSGPRVGGRALTAVWALTLFFPLWWMFSRPGSVPGFANLLIFEGDPDTVFLEKGVRRLVRDGVLTQFISQNAATLNLLGVLSLAVHARRDLLLRRWLVLPGLALALMAALSYTGHWMAGHSPWRIAAVWSILLVPFTADWIMRESSDALGGGRHAARVRAVALGVVIFTCGIVSEGMTVHSAFRESDLRAGRQLRQLLNSAGGSGPEVVIDSADGKYLNVLIASNSPDRLIPNGGPGLAISNPTFVSADGRFDAKQLQEAGIQYLLFRTPRIVATLQTSRQLEELRELGDWHLFQLHGDE